jgi:hypothetical protein
LIVGRAPCEILTFTQFVSGAGIVSSQVIVHSLLIVLRKPNSPRESSFARAAECPRRFIGELFVRRSLRAEPT